MVDLINENMFLVTVDKQKAWSKCKYLIIAIPDDAAGEQEELIQLHLAALKEQGIKSQQDAVKRDIEKSYMLERILKSQKDLQQ